MKYHPVTNTLLLVLGLRHGHILVTEVSGLQLVRYAIQEALAAEWWPRGGSRAFVIPAGRDEHFWPACGTLHCAKIKDPCLSRLVARRQAGKVSDILQKNLPGSAGSGALTNIGASPLTRAPPGSLSRRLRRSLTALSQAFSLAAFCIEYLRRTATGLVGRRAMTRSNTHAALRDINLSTF